MKKILFVLLSLIQSLYCADKDVIYTKMELMFYTAQNRDLFQKTVTIPESFTNQRISKNDEDGKERFYLSWQIALTFKQINQYIQEWTKQIYKVRGKKENIFVNFLQK